jgi:uncharacterized protein (TIGR03083 family)
MVEGLSEDQLNQQSLCEAWTAQGVLCHVTGFVETPLPKFMWTIAKNKGNFDLASQEMANTQLARPVADVLDSLRTKSTKSAALPTFPEEMTIADTAVHTQDIRRPLGLEGSLDEDTVTTGLDFITTHKLGTTLIQNRPPLDGVKMVATDMDWSFGDGAEISGTGEALLMALANRPSALDDLSGPGLDAWR